MMPNTDGADLVRRAVEFVTTADKDKATPWLTTSLGQMVGSQYTLPPPMTGAPVAPVKLVALNLMWRAPEWKPHNGGARTRNQRETAVASGWP